ncbi:MAG: DNA mismatch repair protein MutS [Clostridia bacterium]
MPKFSPMIMQYLEIKEKYKDYIVFYRLGDFYEMFFEDALLASKELDITLTGRDCGQAERAPMCGVPFHSAEAYIARLVEKGYKIAISEQVSDPKESKGIVKREVVKIITPGTVIESSMLDDTKNNFISSIYADEKGAGIAFCDITIGKVFLTQFTDGDVIQKIISEMGKYTPAEIILNNYATNNIKITWFARERLNACIEGNQDKRFEVQNAEELFNDVFDDYDVKKLSIYGLLAVGGLLNYLKETKIHNLTNITEIEVYTKTQFMELDLNARRNLEICETMREKSKKGSLLWVLDKTKTSMGARSLRNMIEKPLVNPTYIGKRLNLTEEFTENPMILDDIIEILKQISDIERLIGKVVYQNASPRDLKSLENSIDKLPQLKDRCATLKCDLGKQIYQKINTLDEVKELIFDAIKEEPPLLVREGNVIKDGYNSDVDELRMLASGGKEKLFEIEAREREKTGIKTLKVGYNKVFGYYLEVTKSFIDQVPDYYIRKQTLANQERYIIEELKTHENTVISAQDKLIKLEQEIYANLLLEIAKNVKIVQNTASTVALLDVICSFANVAIMNNYTKPVVNLTDRIDIKDGRHPVVDLILKDTRFVPNDTFLNTKSDRVAIITGPNMAGKSTYMRQVALIVIMAQIGSFVPAKSAEIGIVDKVFTRVGASDDLATGQSTFMVEMNEVSEILMNATSKSLVILDEIGRGTSTFDGLSIAKAVTEYIANKRKIGCKTLFSTHYHELTEMEFELDGVKNYNIAVKKNGDEIVFLRKIIAGGTDDSYGIEVAKLAGLPDMVIKRAKEILHELENANPNTVYVRESPQISMEMGNESLLHSEIRGVDINTLTPIEAMNLIYKLQKML